MVSRKPRPVHKGHTLRVARGPGSIYAEADMRQLVMAGKDKEAAELYRNAILYLTYPSCGGEL